MRQSRNSIVQEEDPLWSDIMANWRLVICSGNAPVTRFAIHSAEFVVQFKFGQVMPCPDEGYCETKTGYCCKTENAIATTPSS
ncbi:hypothetical protein TELCIR_17531, partial [Teladorsagia circumcincta]